MALIDRTKVREKLLLKHYICCFCGKTITKRDVETDNFECVVTRKSNNTNYLHRECFGKGKR